MEQPASSAASLSAVNRQKIWEFIREVDHSILDVVSPEDEEAYLSMDVATAQRSHQHLVPPICFRELRRVMGTALSRPSLRQVGALVSVLTVVLEGGDSIYDGYTPTSPYPLVRSMKWYVLDFVEGINLVLERITSPLLYDGNVIAHLRDVARFLFLYNVLLCDPLNEEMRSVVADDPHGRTTFYSAVHMQNLVASLVFPLILQGAFATSPLQLPITPCSTVEEMLGCGTPKTCAVCQDAIQDDDEFCVLSSCRHLFCDRCAPARLMPHCPCPVCGAGNSFWMSKSPLVEYQKHLEAGNSAPQLDEDFGSQISGCIKYPFGLY